MDNYESLPFKGESIDRDFENVEEASAPPDYATYDYNICSICSDIDDFLFLTDSMVDEINELRAEVVRWRQVLIKYLPDEWADGLEQDIFDNLHHYVYEDYAAYNYYVNRCHGGKDPLDNPKRARFMNRLRKGKDPSSITYL